MGVPPTNTATILAGAAISAAAAVACWSLSRRRGPAAVADDEPGVGARVLRYPSTLRWGRPALGSALAVGWPVGFAVLAVLDPPDDGPRWLPFLAAVGVMLAIGLFLVRICFGDVRVVVTDFDVTGHQPGRPPTSIAWGEVTGVRFGLTRGHTTAGVVEAADGRRVYAGSYLKDLAVLADAFRSHLDPSTYASAGRGFRYVELLARMRRGRT